MCFFFHTNLNWVDNPHCIFSLFLAGVLSLLTELLAAVGIFEMFVSSQWMLLWPWGRGLMILGLIISFFWTTSKTASLLWTPEWLVHDVIVIKLSENLSIPSRQIECDLIIMLKLFLYKNEFKLSTPKLTILFFFSGSLMKLCWNPVMSSDSCGSLQRRSITF